MSACSAEAGVALRVEQLIHKLDAVTLNCNVGNHINVPDGGSGRSVPPI